EVGRQEPACIVREERIDPHHVAAPEVIEDHLVTQGDERLIWALATLDARLLADAAQPLVGAGRGVSLSIRARVDPQLREDVVTAAEEVANSPTFSPGVEGGDGKTLQSTSSPGAPSCACSDRIRACASSRSRPSRPMSACS